MSARLLEGEVVPDVDPDLERLRARVRTLERELSDAKVEATRAREDADRALSMLRKQLSPLYRALQAVFGELDAAGVRDDAPTETEAPAGRTSDPRWESWKQKMPGRPAEMIDLLLLHGEMGRNQLMAAMRAGKDVVRVTVSRLHTAGLLNKNGGRISLKKF